MLCELEGYVHENLLFVNLDNYFGMSDADIALQLSVSAAENVGLLSKWLLGSCSLHCYVFR